MENDEIGNDLVSSGFLVDEETYVVNADDVLGMLHCFINDKLK